MINVIDGVIVIIFLVMAGRGYYKGLMKMLFSLVSFVAVLLLSIYLAPKIGDYLAENKAVFSSVRGYISDTLCLEDKLNEMRKDEKEKILKTEGSALDGVSYGDSTLDVKNILEECGFPSSWAKKIEKTVDFDGDIQKYEKNAVRSFDRQVCGFLARIVLKIAAFIGCFLLLFLVVRIVFHTVGLIEKLPVINGLNHLGGVCVGLAEGLLLIWILNLLVVFFCQSSQGVYIYQKIQESILGNFFFHKNLFLFFFV